MKMKIRFVLFSLFLSSLLFGQSISDYLVMPVSGISYLPERSNFSVNIDFRMENISQFYDYSGAKIGIVSEAFVLDPEYSRSDLLTTLAYGISDRIGIRVLLPYRLGSTIDFTIDFMGSQTPVTVDGLTGLGDVKLGLWNLYKQDYRESSVLYSWLTLPTGKSENDLTEDEAGPTGDGIFAITAGWGSDYMLSNPLGLLISPNVEYTIHGNRDVFLEADTVSQRDGGLLGLDLQLAATPLSLDVSGGMLELGLGAAYHFNWKDSDGQDGESVDDSDGSLHLMTLDLGLSYRKSSLGNLFLNFKKPIAVGGHNYLIPQEWSVEFAYQPRAIQKSTRIRKGTQASAVERGRKPGTIRPSRLDRVKPLGFDSKSKKRSPKSTNQRAPRKGNEVSSEPEKIKKPRLVDASNSNQKYEELARSFGTKDDYIVKPITNKTLPIQATKKQEVEVEETPTAGVDSTPISSGEYSVNFETPMDETASTSESSVEVKSTESTEDHLPYTTISGAPEYDYRLYGELPRYSNTDLKGMPHKPQLIYDKWNNPNVLPKNLLMAKINTKFASQDTSARGLATAAIGGFTHIPQKRKFKATIDIQPGMALYGSIDGYREYARIDVGYGITDKIIVQAYVSADTMEFTPNDTLGNLSGLAYENMRSAIGAKYLLVDITKLRVVPALFYEQRVTDDMQPEWNRFSHRQIKPEIAVDYTPRSKFLLSTNISYGITLGETVEQTLSYDFPGFGTFDTTISSDMQAGNTLRSDIRATYLLSPIDTKSRFMGVISPNIGMDFIFEQVSQSSFMGDKVDGTEGHTISIVPLVGLRSVGTGSASLNFSLGAHIPISQDGGFPAVTGVVMGLKYQGSFRNLLKKASQNVSN
ncbi:MAG: hypothetical protein HQ507_03795 [Candidatus Marinimicrobia bacterium]|nr:hypothetical protein [Candidatus Neomarinimicrobiota bacterium]